MQKVQEFKKQTFLGRIDVQALNQKIEELNRDGWTVKQIASSGGFGVIPILLLLEKK